MIWLFALIIAILGAAILYHSPQPALSKARRSLLIVLRAIAIFILLSYLFKPVIHFIKKGANAPQVVFLTDNSLSMELMHHGKKKADLLNPATTKLKERYRKAGYDVLEYDFADGLGGKKDNSLLSKSLVSLAEEKDFSRVQQIVLASDGWLRDSDFGFVQKLDKPIFALADTLRESSADLVLSKLKSERYAYRNENSIIRAELVAHEYSGEASVRLKVGDKTVQERKVSLKEGEPTEVEFVHSFSQLGFFAFSVEVSPLRDEKRQGNNSLPGAIEVLKEKERIVVFSDAPAWDNMFILDAIAGNPRWEKQSYQVRDDRILKSEKPATLTAEPDPAAIVIINNGKLKLNLELQSYLDQKLKRGAGLMFLGMPLPELSTYLPLLPSNITSSYQGFIRTQTSAANYPMLSPLSAEVSKLPPLDYYYLTTAKKAQVLATINNPQNSPAIAILENGGQRSISLSFLNLWRWQLNSPDAGYEKMMVNLITWLSNKSLSSFSAVYKNSWLQGEEIEISLRSEDDIRSRALDSQPLLSVFDHKGNKAFEDFLVERQDDFAILFSLEEPGEYSFEISDQKSGKESRGRFMIEPESVEKRDYGFNLSLLGYLSAESGGELFSLEEAEHFQPLPAEKESFVRIIEFELYKKWYILSLFLLVFCVELFFRRRWGLL